MSRTYKATGINLKCMPLGEADKLVTILTREFGLIRVVAPKSRKQNSQLSGRSGLFVVNQLLLAKGRSLDKITQAETLESYPGLSKDLGKLAASQYLAELVLCYALSEQPQTELYELLNEHLRRLERLPHTRDRSGASSVLAHLSHGIFHLLALAGVAPQVRTCCLTQRLLEPNLMVPDWQVGFSAEAGGTVSLQPSNPNLQPIQRGGLARETRSSYGTDIQTPSLPKLDATLNARELTLLQGLAEANLPGLPEMMMASESVETVWVRVERILRAYAQYHSGRAIRSAALVDALSLPDI